MTTDPSLLPPATGDAGARPSHAELRPEPAIRTAHHGLVLFPAMEPMLRSIFADVEHARETVWVETFIYRADKLGRAFGDALASAAARGADVRLLYDPLGSKETDPSFFAGLVARGVQVRAYLPKNAALRVGAPLQWDHSRVIVIDGKGYTGGAAWGDEWLPVERGGKGWHDVCTRVEGPVVTDFRAVFAQRWAEADGSAGAPRDYTTGDTYPDLEFLSDAPGGENLVLERYRARVQRATSRVWIENAYFFPPIELLQDLYAAAARGVDVRVILPQDSDLPILARAARAEYLDWIARGLQIYEYTPGMVHSKFALVDDDWATVGTFNANVTSVRFVNEVNLVVHEPQYVARVAELFLGDLRHCERVTPERVRARPMLEQVKDVLAENALAALETGRASGS